MYFKLLLIARYFFYKVKDSLMNELKVDFRYVESSEKFGKQIIVKSFKNGLIKR